MALVCEHPELLLAVLAPVVDLGLPARVRARPASAQFTDLAPPSYHADVVLRIEDARGRLLHLFIVEIQLRRDPGKRISWPFYVASARTQIGARSRLTLVVLALDAAVAAWCAQPIALDTNGSVLRPLVLQLEQRFGPLPGDAARAIEAADTKTLLAWGTRVLGAESLDEVLVRPARRRTRSGRAASGTRPRSSRTRGRQE